MPVDVGVGAAFARTLIGGDRAGFGRAVDLDHRQAARFVGRDQVHGHNGRTGGDHAQAGEVGGSEARLRHEGLHGGGHKHEEVGPDRFDRVEHGGGIELAVEVDAGTGIERRRELDIETADMEERQGDEYRVAVRKSVHVDGVEGIDHEGRAGEAPRPWAVRWCPMCRQ